MSRKLTSPIEILTLIDTPTRFRIAIASQIASGLIVGNWDKLSLGDEDRVALQALDSADAIIKRAQTEEIP